MEHQPHYLTKYGKFSEQEISLFESKLQSRTFQKGEVLLHTGEVCSTVFFIQSGSAYQFTEVDIEENIISLFTPNDWCFNHASFVHQKPSLATIKAYSTLQTQAIHIADIHQLTNTSPIFFQLGAILNQAVAHIHYFDNNLSSLEKYQHLLQSKPEIFQLFPLKMIASFLKITPETLSRIRKVR